MKKFENNNYTVGIITYPRLEEGKGRFLQAYALYTAVKNLGYTPELLNYYPEEWTAKRNVFDKIRHFVRKPNIWAYRKIIKCKICEKRNKNRMEIAINKYKDFLKKNTGYDCNCVISKEELCKKRYDAWICGSDQIWNPFFSVGVDSAYYLQFAPKNKRISYAASMGTLNIHDDLLIKQKDWISRITYISVREKGTKEMLKNQFDISAEQVCDPTFLMERTWWNDFGNKRIIKDKYLLLFLFDENPLPRKIAEKIADERKLKIVCISGNFKDSKRYTVLYELGPLEFVSLFRYADYVCTQSFHGTVLSVIFNQQFLAFDRNGKGEVDGLLLRIQDLLHSLGLEERIIKKGEKRKKFPEIDFREANKRLDESRIKGLGFLKNALENVVENKMV